MSSAFTNSPDMPRDSHGLALLSARATMKCSAVVYAQGIFIYFGRVIYLHFRHGQLKCPHGTTLQISGRVEIIHVMPWRMKLCIALPTWCFVIDIDRLKSFLCQSNQVFPTSHFASIHRRHARTRCIRLPGQPSLAKCLLPFYMTSLSTPFHIPEE